MSSIDQVRLAPHLVVSDGVDVEAPQLPLALLAAGIGATAHRQALDRLALLADLGFTLTQTRLTACFLLGGSALFGLRCVLGRLGELS
jgi:hypothetical protein